MGRDDKRNYYGMRMSLWRPSLPATSPNSGVDDEQAQVPQSSRASRGNRGSRAGRSGTRLSTARCRADAFTSRAVAEFATISRGRADRDQSEPCG